MFQTVGHDGYNAVCKNNGLIQLGCWDHTRINLDEALKAQESKTKNKSAPLAPDVMHRIQLFDQIERKAKEQKRGEALWYETTAFIAGA